MQHLLFPYGRNTSYVLPLHLACLALVSALKGQRTPHVITMIQDLQQKDGSWTDDTIITALCALALSQSSIQPKYDVKDWLQKNRLPDGSWAAANGEVWEASYALRTGEYPDTTRLINVLTTCMHPNSWWGFSRYAVPDMDDTAVACCALALYNLHLVKTAVKNMVSHQNDNGGWGTFPHIAGVVPHETVTKKARVSRSDITGHVLEALTQCRMQGAPFKKGVSYLLETQEKNGSWKSLWANNDIFATAEIALLLNQIDFADPAVHALTWLETKLHEDLSIVEYAFLVKAFSVNHAYADSFRTALNGFLKKYSQQLFAPTFYSVYFAGLLDLQIYKLSAMVSCLRAALSFL